MTTAIAKGGIGPLAVALVLPRDRQDEHLCNQKPNVRFPPIRAVPLALDGKGAFEDLIQRRERLGELVGRAETLRSKLRHTVMLESNKTQLKAEVAELELTLQQRYEKSEVAIKRATVVDHAISTLYDDRTGHQMLQII